ncbi:MAG: TRAP transporter large permease subunit [Chloroflexota bacterium]
MIEFSPPVVVILMFSLLLIPIFLGFPLAFSLFGSALIVGFLAFGTKIFFILYSQAFGILTNYILVAVPMFIFMGIMVEESGIGKALFETLELWLYKLRGHLAIVVVLTGTALAACTGIIAGSVVMLGMIAVPHMMEKGYNKELATGCICAAGTLGILIPPSVMLIVYGTTAEISVGRLLFGAVGPGFLLSALYLTYIIVACLINPQLAPSVHAEAGPQVSWGRRVWLLFTSAVPIVALVVSVLGVIFLGIAAPTEAAAVGAFIATVLALLRKGLTWSGFRKVALQTARTTGMIGVVAIGALCFVGVLLRLRGAQVISDFILAAPGGAWGIFAIIMLIVFVLGMFIDWLGIAFIMVPLITPIAAKLGFDKVWFAIMVCTMLQTAFLSPPFALAIFFLKGVIPDKYGITMGHIIRGVVPFIALILVGLGLCVAFPEIITWIPSKMITG